MASTSPRVSSRDYPQPSARLSRRLPFPGSPGSSWQVDRDRIKNALLSRGFRTAVAFFIFGLINNILYVIVLSVIWVVHSIYLFVGGARFGWTNCAQGSCIIGGRDAIVSLQSCCAVLLPCCAVQVYSINSWLTKVDRELFFLLRFHSLECN